MIRSIHSHTDEVDLSEYAKHVADQFGVPSNNVADVAVLHEGNADAVPPHIRRVAEYADRLGVRLYAAFNRRPTHELKALDVTLPACEAASRVRSPRMQYDSNKEPGIPLYGEAKARVYRLLCGAELTKDVMVVVRSGDLVDEAVLKQEYNALSVRILEEDELQQYGIAHRKINPFSHPDLEIVWDESWERGYSRRETAMTNYGDTNLSMEFFVQEAVEKTVHAQCARVCQVAQGGIPPVLETVDTGLQSKVGILTGNTVETGAQNAVEISLCYSRAFANIHSPQEQRKNRVSSHTGRFSLPVLLPDVDGQRDLSMQYERMEDVIHIDLNAIERLIAQGATHILVPCCNRMQLVHDVYEPRFGSKVTFITLDDAVLWQMQQMITESSERLSRQVPALGIGSRFTFHANSVLSTRIADELDELVDLQSLPQNQVEELNGVMELIKNDNHGEAMNTLLKLLQKFFASDQPAHWEDALILLGSTEYAELRWQQKDVRRKLPKGLQVINPLEAYSTYATRVLFPDL